MESEASPSTSKQPLSKYLRSCHKTFDYRLTDNAQQKILERLFSEFWRSNDEYRTLFFPNGFGEGPDAYKLSLSQGGRTEYSPSQKGKACGHVFKKGEGVYRCRDCGLDETCVFCSRCFHATNHEGHDIIFAVGGSGGCCDCGDPEAWKRPIHCIYHSPEDTTSADLEDIQSKEDLPPDLLNSMHETISTVLDFMLETLSASPEDISPPLNESEVRQEAIDVANSINDTDSSAEEEKLFAVILWNDENHSFNEVIDHVVDATECTKEVAKNMAERVDSYGRDIVELSEDIPRLLTISREISSIGLAVTVRSARDTFREGMCGLFIDWLKDLVKGKIRSNGTLLGDIVCEELCKEWKRPHLTKHPRIKEHDEKNRAYNEVFIGDRQNAYMSDDEVMVVIENDNGPPVDIDYNQSSGYGGDYDVSMEEESDDTIEPMDEDESIIQRGTTLMQSIADFKKKLRLDVLLHLDVRLWKEARSGLRELYVRTLLVNPEYKKIMGIRFARNYVKLAKAFLTPDREPEHSILLFSVQLFTVPTISTILVAQYNLLSTIFAMLYTFFTSNTVGGIADVNPHAKIDCDSDSFKNRRYFHVFQDLRYIVNNDDVKKAVPKHRHYLSQYLNLISLFQGMNPNVRATQQHIEYENDSWVNAFNVTLQIAKSCRQYSECYTGNTETLNKMDETSDEQQKESIICEWGTSTPDSYGPFAKSDKFSDVGNDDRDNTTTSLREQEFHDVVFPQNPYFLSFRVVKFEVATQPISFHHPLHWFLAELLEHIELLDDDMLKQHGWSSFKNMMLGFDVNSEEELNQRAKEKILCILDYPLRVLVLLVQIRSGLWVRNGFGIRGQCHHYREVSFRENTYDEDILLLQTAFVILDPNLVLASILDRFDLVDWFNGITNHKVYDNTQLSFIAEELLALLIVCVSERANVAGLNIEQEIRREIIHGLCLGPLAYSELAKRISDRLTQDLLFDKILFELSNYRPPDTLTDHGIYELKDQYFEEVDPYFIHYSRNNREEAEEALRNRMRKKMDNSEKQSASPLIIPKLIPITSGPYVRLGNLLHARLLNQIVYYALWHVKTDEKIKSDTLVDEALHLVMLALLDKNNDIIQEIKRKGKQKAVDESANAGEGVTGFVYYAVSDCFHEEGRSATKAQGTSLLDLLLQLSCEQNFKEFHYKIEFIIDKFEQLGNDSAKLIIRKHREKLRAELQSKGGEESELTEYERKKKAAKERQKKIMEQFAIAQQSFIDKNEELYDEYDEMDQDWEMPSNEDHLGENNLIPSETVWPYPTGTCIVCQEETNASSLYGMLGLIQPSTLLRRTPFENSDYVFEVIELSENLDCKYDRSTRSLANPSSINGFPSNSCRAGMYASTCGHLMHVKCFDNYFASLEQRHQLQLARNQPEDVKRKEFICPLCKSLGNVLLPVVWKSKKEVYPGVLKVDVDFNTWLCDNIGLGLEKVNENTHFTPSGSSMLLSSVEFARRFPPSFSSGTTSEVRDLADNGYPQNISQVPINQPRRRDSGGAGRIRDAFAQIVHMLRTPTAIHTANEAGVTTVTLGEIHSLPVTSSISIAGSSEDDDQETIRRMYNRLHEVIQMYRRNFSEMTFQHVSIKSAEYMWDLFGYTISCIEISQRGLNNTNSEGVTGITLVDGINAQTLTLLRVLSETILTYINTMLIGQRGELGLKQLSSHRIQQIFYGHPVFQQCDGNSVQTLISGPVADSSKKVNGIFGPSFQFTKVKPLLLEDPFLVLVEISMFTASAADYEIHHMMRLLFTAEIVRAIISMVESTINEGEKSWKNDQRLKNNFGNSQSFSEPQSTRDFVIWLLQQVGYKENDVTKFFDDIDGKTFLKMIQSFCLPYLRKCIILLHTRYGVVFPINLLDNSDSEKSEFSRLSKLLGLPSLEQICSLCNNTNTSDETILAIIAGWCHHLYTLRQEPLPTVNSSDSDHEFLVSSGISSSNKRQNISVRMNHPAVFELVLLPRNLDALFEESLKRACKKCNTVPHESALCLLCGNF
ncbi:6037_t:CDS:2, partial [Acaulospora morrowiae]